MLRLSLSLLLASMSVACGDANPASDAGSSDAGSSDAGAFDAGPLACGEPETSCPTDRPYEGGACNLTGSCAYVIESGIHEWTFECTGGTWSGSATVCAPGAGCVPPLAESCDAPVRDHGVGTVQIGPVTAGPFVPFADGDEASIVFGGQGSPMLQFRVRTSTDAPSCVELISTLRTTVAEDVIDRARLRLHCGASLGIFTILPIAVDCATPGPVDVELQVDITGIGSTTATLSVPGDVFCTPLPG